LLAILLKFTKLADLRVHLAQYLFQQVSHLIVFATIIIDQLRRYIQFARTLDPIVNEEGRKVFLLIPLSLKELGVSGMLSVVKTK
jgi:hypothetical protein